jgi:hypothetical protein
LSALGYGATAYNGNISAAFAAQATENWTDSAIGSKWIIQAAPIGGTTRTTIAEFSSGATALTGTLGVTGASNLTGTVTIGTSQNASSYVNITNTNAGASANARLDLTRDASLSALTVVAYGSGNSGTIFGASVAKLKAIYDNSTAAESAGLAIGTVAALPLILGTNNAARLTIDSAGIVTMAAYGVGTATFSAAGVISSVSDETWKIKDGVPTDPDAMIQKLSPGYWYYNDEKKETFGVDRQLGFYAQNVNAAIGPEAAPEPETVTTKNEDGTETSFTKPWGYYDRSVLAVVVMSLQKALATIESLRSRVALLEAK